LPTRSTGGAYERNPNVNRLLLRSSAFVRAARRAVKECQGDFQIEDVAWLCYISQGSRFLVQTIVLTI